MAARVEEGGEGVVAARPPGGRGEERTDGPFCKVDFGAVKDERSKAGPYNVFGSASSGNGRREKRKLSVLGS